MRGENMVLPSQPISGGTQYVEHIHVPSRMRSGLACTQFGKRPSTVCSILMRKRPIFSDSSIAKYLDHNLATVQGRRSYELQRRDLTCERAGRFGPRITVVRQDCEIDSIAPSPFRFLAEARRHAGLLLFDACQRHTLF
jgi:hypothetical protein